MPTTTARAATGDPVPAPESASEKTTQKAFREKVAHLSEAPLGGSAGDLLAYSSREQEATGRNAGAAGPSEVRQGLPYEALDALASTLGLTQETLTRVLDVSERTLQRRKSSGRLGASESDRLWRIGHVWHLALEAFDGSPGEARTWLTTPKRALSGDTPVEHLDTEPGLRLVEQMLATIEHTMPV